MRRGSSRRGIIFYRSESRMCWKPTRLYRCRGDLLYYQYGMGSTGPGRRPITSRPVRCGSADAVSVDDGPYFCKVRPAWKCLVLTESSRIFLCRALGLEDLQKLLSLAGYSGGGDGCPKPSCGPMNISLENAMLPQFF